MNMYVYLCVKPAALHPSRARRLGWCPSQTWHRSPGALSSSSGHWTGGARAGLWLSWWKKWGSYDIVIIHGLYKSLQAGRRGPVCTGICSKWLPKIDTNKFPVDAPAWKINNHRFSKSKVDMYKFMWNCYKILLAT